MRFARSHVMRERSLRPAPPPLPPHLQIDRMSKQNPGFGIAGPAHELPHEQPVEDNTMYPGPGKYETNTSEIAKANGHGSVFSPPTRRKGSKTADIAPEVPRTGGKKGKAKSKAPKVEGGA